MSVLVCNGGVVPQNLLLYSPKSDVSSGCRCWYALVFGTALVLPKLMVYYACKSCENLLFKYVRKW